jgi:hypothetical protein
MEEPAMTTNRNESWVMVYSGAPFETEVIRGMLETNDVRCIVEDHTSLVTAYYSGVGGDMRILVSPEDMEKALQLIAENKD